MPVFTLQKAQARVHVSPKIITVACFWLQHSPMLGQAASSHTVFSFSRRISARVSDTAALVGARTRSQSGFRTRGVSIVTGKISFMRLSYARAAPLPTGAWSQLQ
jgi:hypothetical protein